MRLLLLATDSKLFPSLQSLPCQSMLHTVAGLISGKHRSDFVTSMLKHLQWLPTAFEISKHWRSLILEPLFSPPAPRLPLLSWTCAELKLLSPVGFSSWSVFLSSYSSPDSLQFSLSLLVYLFLLGSFSPAYQPLGWTRHSRCTHECKQARKSKWTEQSALTPKFYSCFSFPPPDRSLTPFLVYKISTQTTHTQSLDS